MELSKNLQLPCGVIIKNRIAKSAMSENLCFKHHNPNGKLIRLYKTWKDGDAGLNITGNVMIDNKAIGEPGNVVISENSDTEAFSNWAKQKPNNGHLWVQLNHPGRQAFKFLNKEVVAPSAVPMSFGRRKSTKRAPRVLKHIEILEIIKKFASSALFCKEIGFTGVQIHGAHGYLISQFLSPLTNLRTDDWGGSPEKRMRFLLEVYQAIRTSAGDDFPIGLKLNSADFQKGGFSQDDSEKVVVKLSELGLDLIEISGGSYESPAALDYKKKSTIEREAYFMDFSERLKSVTSIPVMLTGGFRTVSVMEEAISNNKTDLIGMGRPFAQYPYLAKEILNGERKTVHCETRKTGIKALNAGMEVAWFERQMERMGNGLMPKESFNPYCTAIGYGLKMLK